MQKAFQDSLEIEKAKQNKILENFAKLERHQELLAQENARQLKIKIQQRHDKQAYQKRVRDTMYQNTEDMKQTLISSRKQKEENMKRADYERNREQFIRKEQELMKRETKLQNVARIDKANKYHQHKLSLRIQADATRS